MIGVREGGEKLLVKSEDEYTSPIAKIYKVGEEYIIGTENSIYVVSVIIDTKHINKKQAKTAALLGPVGAKTWSQGGSCLREERQVQRVSRDEANCTIRSERG